MINETAKSTVILDGKQAEDELKKLTEASKGYRDEMEKCRKSNDLAGFDKAKKEYDKNQKSVKSLRTELFNLDKVMSNLSGASMNQLKAAQKAITAELNKMTRGTEAYIEKSKQLKEVNTEIGKVKSQMSGTAGAGQQLWDKISIGATKFFGILAAVGISMESFKKLIASSQTLTDKFNAIMEGLTTSTEEFFASIRDGDFSNLLENMQKAYDRGKKYREEMDSYAKTERAINILTEKRRYEYEKLNDAAHNSTLSAEENYDAAKKGLDLIKEQYDKTIALREKQLASTAKYLNLANVEGKTEEEKIKNIEAIMQKYIEEDANFKDLRENAEKYNKTLDAMDGLINDLYWSSKITREEQEKIVKRLYMTPEQVSIIDNATEKTKEYAALLKQIENKQSPEAIQKYIDALNQKLQADYAFDAEQDRLQKTLYASQNKMDDDAKKKRDDSLKSGLNQLELAYKQRGLMITQAYQKENLNQEWYDQQMLANEIAMLYAKKQLLEKNGQDTTDIQTQIAEKEIQLEKKIADEKDKINQQKKKSDEDYFNEKLKQLQEEEQAIWDDYLLQEKADQEALEKKKQYYENLKGIAENTASSLGESLGQMMTDQEMSAKSFAKNMVLIALDTLHAIVRMAIAEIWAKAMASGESLATWGAAGVAKAMAISAFVEIAFAAAKAAISGSMGGGSSSSSGSYYGKRQHFEGKYDVIGAQDKRHYSARYGGVMRTGIYGEPTLVAERGDELVVDGSTLRNIRVNFPFILPAIQAARVSQNATGNYSQINQVSPMAQSDPELKALIANQSAVISALINRLNEPITADISYDRATDRLSKGASAESRASKG